MSAFDSTFSASRNGKVSDPVLAEGANPMQSMDLGSGKHAAEGVCRVRAAAVGVLV
jgi:pyruvate-formate lyase